MTTTLQDSALQQARRYHQKKQWNRAAEIYKKNVGKRF